LPYIKVCHLSNRGEFSSFSAALSTPKKMAGKRLLQDGTIFSGALSTPKKMAKKKGCYGWDK
jgi:hypothetical protein